MHETMAATLDTRDRARSRRSKSRRAAQQALRTAALADDRPAHAQRLDRPQRSRRREGRRNLALASSADGKNGVARASASSRSMDEELPAGGAFRWRRQARSGLAGPCAQGNAAHGRQSHSQRRSVAQRFAHARLSRLRRGGYRTRCGFCRSDPRYGKTAPRRDEAQPGSEKLPRLRSRRDQLQSPRCAARSDRQNLARRHGAGRHLRCHPVGG